MKALLLKTVKQPSQYEKDFYFAFFKGEDGKSYRSCLYVSCGNFKRNGWDKLIGREAVMLDNLRVKGTTKIIDADSVPKEIPYEAEQKAD